jgi:non-heme chloroperoxidase
MAAQPMAASAPDPVIRSARFATSDGVRLRVLESCPDGGTPARSTTPVIAFVPGWSMPASVWHEQLKSLGAAHCVAALDPRGQGESEVPVSGYDIARRAQDVRDFLSRYSSVLLVGWSLGALECLEHVDRHGSDGIAGLVLVDTSVGEDPPPPSGASFTDALRKDRRAAIEDFVRSSFRSPRPAAEIEALVQSALRMPLEASLSLFPRSVPREHWRRLARGFPKPLLYAVTPQFAAQAKSLQKNRPQTRIAVFENAGHALFLDEPARFNALLSGFAAELASSPGTRK